MKCVSLCALFGVVISVYLIYQHYKPAGGSFCIINDYVNCDIVNKSIYAEILGFPVGGLGLVAYLTLFIGSVAVSRGLWKQRALKILALFAGFSFAFSLYLTYVEFFILEAVCPLCVTSQILIFIIFILLLTSLWQTKKSLQQSL